MRKESVIFLLLSLFLVFFTYSCKQEPTESAASEIPLIEEEINIQKIEAATGIQFKILKTETIGYTPIHRFYWVCLKEKEPYEKVEVLADAIIKDIISKKPKIFDSFTIHFFCESDIGETLEKSNRFAYATFLPEGSWMKVGRVPIDDYKNYKLTCTFIEY